MSVSKAFERSIVNSTTRIAGPKLAQINASGVGQDPINV